MTTEFIQVLTHLFPSLLLIVLGVVIRMHGPQGFVHGIVDWSKVDDAARKRAGRIVGNVLFAMAALLAGHAMYDAAPFAVVADRPLENMVFVGGMVALILVMILVLLRLQTKDKNGTHGR